MYGDVRRHTEILEMYGDIWRDMGRCGVLRGGQLALGRCREMYADVGRYGEIWGDVGRCGGLRGGQLAVAEHARHERRELEGVERAWC